MPTILKKEPGFIKPPVNNPADTTSGMQPAASGSIIGRSAAPATPLAGQDIGRTAASGYTVATVRP